MGAREDFETAIARLVREKLLDDGMVFVDLHDLSELAEREGVPEKLAGAIVEGLESKGLIYRDGRSYRGGEQLILTFEQEVDRTAFYESNAPRRELLQAAADALDQGETLRIGRDPADNFSARSWNELHAAAVILDAAGLGKLHGQTLGGSFDFDATADGYELARDTETLVATLPTSAEEDPQTQQEAPMPSVVEPGDEGDARPRVFISYSHRDQEFVLALVAELQSQGVRVWIDQVELEIGDSLIERISEAISAEDFVVAVISEDSAKSGWCQKELSLAVTEGINNKRVKVLPVRLGEVEMPPMLRDIKWGEAAVDASPSDLAAALARAIKRNLARQATGLSATPASDAGEEDAVPRNRTSYDRDRTEAALAETYEALMRVVEQWDRNRAGSGTTDDLRAQQRRLRYALDGLDEEIQGGLPLTSLVSEAEWNEYFRLRDYREIEPDVREEFRAVRSLVRQGLPVPQRWRIVRTDGAVDTPEDATAYRWWIERGDDSRSITVSITGSAVWSSNEGLPKDVAAAKETEGRSVVEGLLGLDAAPRRVSVSTAGVRWEAEDPEVGLPTGG